MRDWDHGQAVDVCEVARIARVQRQLVRQRDSGNHGVIGSGGDLPSGSAQRPGDLPEGTGRAGIERERIKVGLGLL